MRRKPGFIDLSSEIKTHIFQYLNLSDFSALNQVSIDYHKQFQIFKDSKNYKIPNSFRIKKFNQYTNTISTLTNYDAFFKSDFGLYQIYYRTRLSKLKNKKFRQKQIKVWMKMLKKYHESMLSLLSERGDPEFLEIKELINSIKSMPKDYYKKNMFLDKINKIKAPIATNVICYLFAIFLMGISIYSFIKFLEIPVTHNSTESSYNQTEIEPTHNQNESNEKQNDDNFNKEVRVGTTCTLMGCLAIVIFFLSIKKSVYLYKYYHSTDMEPSRTNYLSHQLDILKPEHQRRLARLQSNLDAKYNLILNSDSLQTIDNLVEALQLIYDLSVKEKAMLLHEIHLHYLRIKFDLKGQPNNKKIYNKIKNKLNEITLRYLQFLLPNHNSEIEKVYKYYSKYFENNHISSMSELKQRFISLLKIAKYHHTKYIPELKLLIQAISQSNNKKNKSITIEIVNEKTPLVNKEMTRSFSY